MQDLKESEWRCKGRADLEARHTTGNPERLFVPVMLITYILGKVSILRTC